MSKSIPEFTEFDPAGGFSIAAGPLNLELNFGMTAPTPVASIQEQLSDTDTVAGDGKNARAGTPVDLTQGARSQSGFKLRISFKKNTIKVVNFKKRDASQLAEGSPGELRTDLVEKTGISAARIVGYSKEELEVAMTLAEMPFGPPARKEPKVDIGDSIILKSTHATRKQRIVDPTHPADALLILGVPKAGSDIYDSDAESLAGDVTPSTTSKGELFRNIQWGPAASDTSNDADFPTEPSFDQFVPGRWERLADGTLLDQKHKLLVRLTSKDGRKMIFKNPPPKDWNDQRAITCLNKRVSQQIRRNTAVRFRLEVESYVNEERVWINAHLTNGKPADGWKTFVAAFNARFAGKLLEGCEGPRPTRTHSSLTKEVERFGKNFYAQGKVPQIQSKGGKKGNGRGTEKHD